MKFIIVLGGPTIVMGKDGNYLPSECLLSRLNKGLETWQDMSPYCRDLYTIVTGLSDGVFLATIPSSSVMKDYLVNRGIPASRIMEEPQANNIVENAFYSCQLIKKQCGNPETKVIEVVIVTSELYIERSRKIFSHFLPKSLVSSYPSSQNNIRESQLAQMINHEKRALESLAHSLAAYFPI